VRAKQKKAMTETIMCEPFLGSIPVPGASRPAVADGSGRENIAARALPRQRRIGDPFMMTRLIVPAIATSEGRLASQP
jgi:hypothetical protein